MMKRLHTRHGSSAVIARLAIPFAALWLGASLIGVLHHHPGGTVDPSCATCSASVASATTVPVIAAPAGPEPRPSTVVLLAESRPAHPAILRASSRAPPSA